MLLVLDGERGERDPAADLLAQLPPGVAVTLVCNKIDLTAEPAGLEAASDPPRVCVSAKTGAGLDALRAHLMQCMGYAGAESGAISARARHLDALRRARGHVEAAELQLEGFRAGELVAEELRDAHDALGEITGKVTTEELLGRIFATFCIGK